MSQFKLKSKTGWEIFLLEATLEKLSREIAEAIKELTK